jgi:hypothetical protein
VCLIYTKMIIKAATLRLLARPQNLYTVQS